MKKSKRLLSICLAGAMLAGSVPVTFIAGAVSDSTIKVAAISDIRYQAGAADKDGLLLSKSAALLDTAIDKVTSSDADVLLVTGDLTNDGSNTSHQYVAGKLAEVEAKGIDVYVIPGERDVREGGINNAAVTKSVFESLYKDFGYDESLQDSGSASYVADLGHGFKVVMSDSVAANGCGQLPQWVVDQASTAISGGSTVFAASHHPAVGRGSVDKTFIDLLNTIRNVNLNLGGTNYSLYTEDVASVAASLGLMDDTRILPENGADPAALADAGVKYLFTGHGYTMSIAGYTTTNGAQMYDVMTGSLVGSGSGVRFATLNKGVDGMKEQRAEFSANMLTSAAGVSDVKTAAHNALAADMPNQVDDAIDTALRVITHLLGAVKPNVQNLVRTIDLEALGLIDGTVASLAGGALENVKSDLASQYVESLFGILNNETKLRNIVTDILDALEQMDFNGRDFYGFLADIFGAIQRGDGKTPTSVEGIFNALRNGESDLLIQLIQSFADHFSPSNLVNLLNEILDLQFNKNYTVIVVTIGVHVHLRSLLAGPFNIVDGVTTVSLNLWDTLDGAIVLPNGQKISEIARPLVNALILGGDNDASTQQTPARFTQNLKDKAVTVVDLLLGFGVGDLIGENVFAQGQSGAYVARMVTLEEVGAYLDELAPDLNADALTAAEWAKVRDALNALGRFTAEQQATVNGVLKAGTETEAAFTQADKLNELANAQFYQSVAADFTQRVNALPAIDSLSVDNAAEVYALQSEYDQFYTEIKENISAETVEKLNAAVDKIYALENYDPAVDAVVQKIAAIGTVTVDSEAAIQEAREAYEALDIRQQKLVTNYQVLVDAEAALIVAKENAAAIQAVEDRIDAIGEVTASSVSKSRIDRARQAYDALAPELQEQVANYQTLLDAEARYAQLVGEAEDAKAAQPVIDLINAIGTVTLNSGAQIEAAEAAYALLTESQQALVTNYQVLVEARAVYDELVQQAAGNQQAAQAVIDQINAIGEVTLDSEAVIRAAREAYDALTPAQQALVINYAVLTNAEATLAALQKNAADQAAADAVEALIDAIGDVTLEKEGQINAAREAYNALTSDQKRLVENFAVLTAAEAQLSVLKNDFLFEDEATGIALRASSGVLPVDTAMRVEQIANGDIYDRLAPNYKVFRLYEIALFSGGEAVTPAQAVQISVPQFAVDTAVYAVSADGTVTPVEAVLENGSFNFSAESVGMFLVAQPKTTVDTAALQAAIASFEKLDQTIYTDASLAYAQAAYEAAKAELDANYEFTTANQQKVDAAAAALNDAIELLAVKPASFTALRLALLNAKMKDPADYTNFAAVTDAINAAQAILDQSGSYDVRNQAEIDAAEKALNDALGALQWAAPDFSAIDAALAAIPQNSQNYTSDSWAAVEAARDAALAAKETITRENGDWEQQVEKYAQAVTDAVNGLVLKNTTPANTAALERAIKLAALYSEKDYSNYGDLTLAVEEAQELLATRPTSDQQTAVDAAEDAILQAISGLEWANSSILYRALSTVVRLVRLPSIFF